MKRSNQRPRPGARESQRPPAGVRPGIAMLLVLVALVVTVILAGATLTTRENAPVIGMNAGGAAEATWSAESGVNFAIGAISQTHDLDALFAGDSTLTSSMTIGGAVVQVRVTNLAGDPPTDADREVIVRAEASVGGVVKTLEKRVVRIPPGDLTDAADPYLSEFAIFATEVLDIDSGATVGVWDLSPLSSSSVALAKIGVGFSDAIDLSIGAGVGLSRAGLYADLSASLGLEAAVEAAPGFDARWMIPIDVPTVPGGSAATFGALPDQSSTSFDADAVNLTVPAGAHYDELRVRNNGKVVLDSVNGAAYRFRRILIEDGGCLAIRGSVQVLVDEECVVSHGFITLQDAGASATMYLGEDLDIDASKLGIVPADHASPVATVGEYNAPASFRLIALAPSLGGSSSPQWAIDSNTAIVGFLHNPLGVVKLTSGSGVYGHVVAREFGLADGCRLLYCPTLDTMLGYTSPQGPLYDSAGDPIIEFVSIILEASALPTAGGFINKIDFEYQALDTTGVLDVLELDTTIHTVTETLNLGGLGIY